MKKQPKGRTLAEFQPLSYGESQLLKACAEGEFASLNVGRPSEKTERNKVRASFIRFLALGGDDEAPLHEMGVQLSGAWIEGELNMFGATVPTDLSLHGCHFEVAPVLRSAQIAGAVSFSGSKMPGLSADAVRCRDDLFLSNKFTSTGEVSLLDARIGGVFDCRGAELDGQGGDALSADRAVIHGGMFLSAVKENGEVALGDDGKPNVFTAIGTVRLSGAQIGGDLVCNGAKLDGKTSIALNASGMTVRGSFFFLALTSPIYGIDLRSAVVGRLIDDAPAWGGNLALDGFIYEHLAGGAPTDAEARLAWLDKQSAKYTNAVDFRPHPWKQLQKVLRAMGHTEEARQVAIAFEDRLRAINLIGQTPTTWGSLRRRAYRTVTNGMHWSFKILMGYGYRPLRLGAWMLAVWLFCAAIYWAAALQGVMAPSNPLVFQNLAPYASCEPNWYLCGALPEAYTGFSPLAYSLDLLLPVVNLHQETDWGPLTPTPHGIWYHELLANWSFKHVVRLVIWFEILFGWIASLLLVAVVSGLTKRSED